MINACQVVGLEASPCMVLRDDGCGRTELDVGAAAGELSHEHGVGLTIRGRMSAEAAMKIIKFGHGEYGNKPAGELMAGLQARGVAIAWDAGSPMGPRLSVLVSVAVATPRRGTGMVLCADVD